MAVARLVRLVGGLVFAVIALGILLVVVEANEGNAIVGAILDLDRFLVRPFRDVFDLERGREHLQIAINWGIAAVVYFVVAALIAAVVRAVFTRATSSRRRRRE
jgi:hypothetical protein